MSDGNNPVIELKGVVKRFGAITAVDGVDLTLDRGEFLTIFGPNGAGKTTLLRMMAGLSKVSVGQIRIEGLELEENHDELRMKIGLISHQSFVYGQLSALQNLMFFAELYGVASPRDRALELLGEVGLEGRADDPVQAFSRGMLQRLSIARALIHSPDILYLDEPFTGLDQHATEMLKNQLASLHNQRRTIVMITHNLRVGVEMGSRVALQVAGKIHLDMVSSEFNHDAFDELYFKTVGEAHY